MEPVGGSYDPDILLPVSDSLLSIIVSWFMLSGSKAKLISDYYQNF
jgi:hypothetical protein